MSVRVATGEFNIGTGTTPVPIALAFDPTLTGCGIVFSWSGQTSNTVARGTIQAGYGIAGTLGGTLSASGTSKDTGNSACQQGERDDAVIHAVSTAGAAAGDATIAFTSTGFTITPSNAFTNNILVKYWAVSVPMLATTTAAEPAAPGTVQTTGLPRPPRMGLLPIMGGVSSFASPSQVTTDFDLSIGVFLKNSAGTIKNGVMCGASNDGQATTQSGTYVNASECLARFNTSLSATILSRAACSAMGASTFDLTYAAVEGAGTHAFPVLLAFDGVWEMNTLTAATNTTTDMIITPGFQALGGLVAMAGNTAFSTLGTASGSARHFFGMHAGVGSEHAIGTRDTNGQVGALCTTGADNSHSIFILNNAAIFGAGHLTAIGSTTTTFRMTTATTAVVGWVVSVGEDALFVGDPLRAYRPSTLGRPAINGDALPPASAATTTPPAIDAIIQSRAWRSLRWQPIEDMPPQLGVFTGIGLPDAPSPVIALQRRPPGPALNAPPPTAGAVAPPPPDAFVPGIRVSVHPSPTQSELPPQGQISVIQDVSNFDPTPGSSISVTITTTGRLSAIHAIVVGTHSTFVPGIASSGLPCVNLNYADDSTVTHDFAWHAYRLNIAAFTYTVTFNYFDPIGGPTVPATVTNRGLLIREIGNAARFTPPTAVAAEQSAPGAGTDAISAGTITPSSRPALASAVSWATTTAAGPPSAGTGFTGNAAVFPKAAVNQATPEQQRITAFAPVSGTFTHTIGAANNYDSVMALFVEAGAESGLGSVLDDARRPVQRRAVAPPLTIEVPPAQASGAAYLPPDSQAPMAARQPARPAAIQSEVPPQTGVFTGDPPADSPAPAAKARRLVPAAAPDAPPAAQALAVNPPPSAYAVVAPVRVRGPVAASDVPPPAVVAAAPVPDFRARVAAVFRRTSARVEELPPVVPSLAATPPPDTRSGLRAWVNRLRGVSVEIYPQAGVKTGTGLPATEGIVRPWWRRLPFFRPEELPPKISSAVLKPPFVAVFDDVALTVDFDAVELDAEFDEISLTLEEP